MYHYYMFNKPVGCVTARTDDRYPTVMDYFKEKGFFVRTPVAIISGAEDDESLDKAKGYPIVDVLPKPFNERDVQRVVEKCLAVYF